MGMLFYLGADHMFDLVGGKKTNNTEVKVMVRFNSDCWFLCLWVKG